MAHIAMRAAFTTDCDTMYLGAELVEHDDPVTGETITETPKQSGAVKFWNRLRFRRIPMKEYEKVLKEKELYGMVPMKMSKRSDAVKKLPHMENVIDELFPNLQDISKAIDGKKRTPLLRICTPALGDVKI